MNEQGLYLSIVEQGVLLVELGQLHEIKVLIPDQAFKDFCKQYLLQRAKEARGKLTIARSLPIKPM